MQIQPEKMWVHGSCSGQAFWASMFCANHRNQPRSEAPTRESIVRNEMKGYGAETIFPEKVNELPADDSNTSS